MDTTDGLQAGAVISPMSGGGLKGAVDVLMAAWNRETTIARAVRSVLHDPAIRSLIVIDDASTDHTCEAARDADDGSGRLIIKKMKDNRGPAAARNTAIAMSDAPWIAVVDADDYLMPGRFSRLIALASGWDLVGDDILQLREDRIGIEKPVPLLSALPFTPWACDFETFIRGNISIPGRPRKELGFFKPLMRREFFYKHNLVYDENLRLGEDYAIYARALALGARFLIAPAAGYVSLTRDDSLSARHSKEDLEKLRDSDLALMDLPQLSRRERRAVLKHYHSIDARVQWLAVIEAVKQRNAAGFFRAAIRSKEVALYVSARLREQLIARSLKRFGIQ